jgi:peptidylprolyl isomerase
MSRVEKGNKVKIHYTGTLEDGTVFDSSKDRDPLEFEIGAGNVIPGFENGVIGMAVGESKTINIEPSDGYGNHRPDLIVEVEKSKFPENISPEVGLQLQLQQPDGKVVDVIVSEMKEEIVVLDANHPLAGRKLTFEVELVAVA